MSGFTRDALDALLIVADRSLRPVNLSIAVISSRGLLVKSCESPLRPVKTTAARSLVPKLRLDEAPRGRRLDARRAREIGVHVVEDDQVDATLDVVVGLHVGLDRRGREERTLRALDRDVDQGEGRDLLRLAVLEHLEVVGLRGRSTGVALRVGDDGIDLDVVDFDAEGHRRADRAGGAAGAGARLPAGRPEARRCRAAAASKRETATSAAGHKSV